MNVSAYFGGAGRLGALGWQDGPDGSRGRVP